MKINCTISAGSAGHMHFSKVLPEANGIFGLGAKQSAQYAAQALALVAELQRVAQATYGADAAAAAPADDGTVKQPAENAYELDRVRLEQANGFPFKMTRRCVVITGDDPEDRHERVTNVFRAYWTGPTSTTALLEFPGEPDPREGASFELDEIEQIGLELMSAARRRREQLEADRKLINECWMSPTGNES
jgi:hypothetical protein